METYRRMYVFPLPLPPAPARSLETLSCVSVSKSSVVSHLPVSLPPRSPLTVLSFTAVRHVKSHPLLLEAPVEQENGGGSRKEVICASR